MPAFGAGDSGSNPDGTTIFSHSLSSGLSAVTIDQLQREAYSRHTDKDQQRAGHHVYGKDRELQDRPKRFIGPTRTLVSGETLQVKDYSKFNWTMFDPQQRMERRERVFPEELKKAFSMGASILG